MCGKVCVDIFTDIKNCGDCGKTLTGLNRICDTGRSFTWPQDSPPCPKNRELQQGGWLSRLAGRMAAC